MLTVTFQFATPAEAIDALSRLTQQGAIAFADRPDVGAPLPPPAPSAVDAMAAFGNAAQTAAQVFGGAGVPVPPPALSTAAVVPLPTAPVAPPPGLPTPPPAAAPSAPNPAATVVAPTAPAAPTNPAGGVEVDADGLPWDARIHASGEGGKRPKNADGRWRQKRGLNDAALKKRVEDELRAAMAAPGAAVTAPPSSASSAGVPTPPPAAAPTAPSAPPTPPAPPAAPAGDTFATLMARLGPPMAQGKITMQAVCDLLAPFGLNAPAQLAARPDLVPMVAPVIDAALAGLA